MEYVQKPNGAVRQTVRGAELARPKNLLTKEKIYIIVKLNCEAASNSTWQLSEESVHKYRVEEMSFAEIFGGEPPQFEQTFGRGQFSRSSQLNQSKTSLNNSSQVLASSKPSSANAVNSKKVLSQPANSHSKKTSVSSSSSSATATSLDKKSSASKASPSEEDNALGIFWSKDPNAEVNQNALRIIQILNKKSRFLLLS